MQRFASIFIFAILLLPLAYAATETVVKAEITSVSDKGVDYNNNSLYDELLVEVEVFVSTPGTYYATGELNIDGISIATKVGCKFIEGRNNFTLSFSGEELSKYKFEGSFTIYIYIYLDSILVTEYAHTTNRYSSKNFEGYFVSTYINSARDYGVDYNNNSLYDELLVEVEVFVSTVGLYYATGELRIDNISIPTKVACKFIEGKNNFTLSFSGEELSKYKFDGSFMLYIYIYLDSTIVTKYAYATNRYSSQNFEGYFVSTSTISIEGIKEYGFDADHDGLYDYLRIEVFVSASSDTYGIVGYIYTEKGEEIFAKAYNDTFLKAGKHVVLLDFDGKILYQSGYNGSYIIEITTSEPQKLDTYSTYTTKTKNYNYTEFESPLELKIVRISEEIKDNDGDKLIDILAIVLEIEIEASGKYFFDAYISPIEKYILERYPRATFEAYLELGRKKVSLDFYGTDIYSSGLAGSYKVEISIYSGLWKKTIVYNTAFYNLEDFEKPKELAFFTGNVEEILNDYGLNLIFEVEMGYYDNYIIYGDIGYDSYKFAWYKNITELSAGKNWVKVSFSGSDIYNSKIDGPYIVTAKIIGKDGSDSCEIEYKTKRYLHTDFLKEEVKVTEKAIPIPEISIPKVDTNAILIKSNVAIVETSKNMPEVLCAYSKNESIGKFKVVYTRLIGYQDKNMDGIYEVGEEVYEAMLTAMNWFVTEVIISENMEYGKHIKYDALANLSMKEIKTGRVIENWGEIKFTYIMSQNSSYMLIGEAEMKIDISIEIKKPINASGLALEQFLSDETGNHGFGTYEEKKNIYKGDEEIKERVFVSKQEKQKIDFVSIKNEVSHAFYSWLSKVNITYEDGKGIGEVLATYSTDGKVMRVFLSYPYNPKIKKIEHDPSIGVIKENLELGVEVVKKYVSKVMPFNPLYYFIAIAIGVLVLYGIRKKEEY
ncbi:MAG: hypothetical protein AB1779_05530 [Candidatus Thermoplasmatota archaeon]